MGYGVEGAATRLVGWAETHSYKQLVNHLAGTLIKLSNSHTQLWAEPSGGKLSRADVHMYALSRLVINFHVI